MRPPEVKSDRYMAFLLATLPKLAATAIYGRWRLWPMRRLAVLGRAIDRVTAPGICLEFGVYHGRSLRYSGQRLQDRTFYGFDSFQGFPEDGRPDWKEDFQAIQLPAVPRNCNLIPGWFEDTVPGFAAANKKPIAFVNIDCGLYSSTRQVFTAIGPQLRPGTIIYFDEMINYSSYLWNEMPALFEFLERTGMGIEWIAVHHRVRPVEETVDLLETRRHPHWGEDVTAGYQRPAAAILTAANTDMALLDDPAEASRIASLAQRFDALTERHLRRATRKR